VEALVERGRDDYKLVLQDEFIQSLRVRSHLITMPLPYLIRRGELEERIIEALSGKETSIVVLYGSPYRGKKTLLQSSIKQYRFNNVPLRSIAIRLGKRRIISPYRSYTKIGPFPRR
jgi:hypothetical protein